MKYKLHSWVCLKKNSNCVKSHLKCIWKFLTGMMMTSYLSIYLAVDRNSIRLGPIPNFHNLITLVESSIDPILSALDSREIKIKGMSYLHFYFFFCLEFIFDSLLMSHQTLSSTSIFLYKDSVELSWNLTHNLATLKSCLVDQKVN